MNEPTIKLYKQAQEFAYKNISKEYWNTDNFHAVVSGKFAELIVRECTAALFDESERLSGLYSEEDNWNSAEEYEIRSNQCIDDIALIEKHFGVEE